MRQGGGAYRHRRQLGFAAELEHQQLGGGGLERTQVQHRRAAPAGIDGDVLLAVDHIGDRARDRCLVDVHLPQLGPGVGAVDCQRLVNGALDEEVAGGGQHAARAGVRIGHAPLLGLRLRVPGEEIAFLGGGGFGLQLLPLLRLVAVIFAAVGTPRPGDILVLAVGQAGVDRALLLRAEIDEPGLGRIAHRVPGVRRHPRRHHQVRRGGVVSAGLEYRAAGLHVDAARPGVVRDVVLRADQLPVGAVDHVEKAVLRRLHRHLAQLAVDLDVGENDRLGAGEIPVFLRHHLVMPFVVPGIGIDGEHRAQEQVVPFVLTAEMPHVRGSVAGADDDGLRLGIVGEAVPRVAAAAGFPELAGPGLGRHRHHAVAGFVVGSRRRIGRHDVELPDLLAGLGVPGGNEPARAVIGATVADHHLAVIDARRAGDRIGRLVGVERVDAPHFLAGLRVDGDQSSVERADVELALPRGDSARRGAAAGEAGPLGVHLRIVSPQLAAVGRVVGGDDVVDALVIEHPVDLQRARLDAAEGLEIVVPGEAELADGLVVDLRQRAVALFLPPATVAHPVADIRGRVDMAHRLAVDHRRRVGRLRRRLGVARDQRGQQQRSRPQRVLRPQCHSIPPALPRAWGDLGASRRGCEGKVTVVTIFCRCGLSHAQSPAYGARALWERAAA